MGLIKQIDCAEAIYKALRTPMPKGPFTDTMSLAVSLVKEIPIVDAEPIKRGRNVATEYDDVDEFICSECGLHLENWVSVEVDEDTGEKTYHEFRLRRCPNCGARIDK